MNGNPEGPPATPELDPARMAEIQAQYQQADRDRNFYQRMKAFMAAAAHKARRALDKLMGKSEERRAVKEAGGTPPPFRIEGDANDPESLKNWVEETKVHAQEIWERARHDPEQVPADSGSFSGILARELLNRIETSELKGDVTAVVLVELLRKAITGKIPDPRVRILVDGGLLLLEHNPGLLNKVKDAVVSAAGQAGIDRGAIDEFRRRLTPAAAGGGEGGNGGPGNGEPPDTPEGGDGDHEGGDDGRRVVSQEEMDKLLDIEKKSLRGYEESYLRQRFKGDKDAILLLASLKGSGQFREYIWGGDIIVAQERVQVLDEQGNPRRDEYGRFVYEERDVKDHYQGLINDSEIQLRLREIMAKYPNANEQEELWKIVSRVYSDRVVDLVGDLHAIIDEAKPKTFWEEEEGKGMMFDNIKVLFSWVETQLKTLQRQDLSVGEGESFYVKERVEYDLRTPLPKYQPHIEPHKREYEVHDHLVHTDELRFQTEKVAAPFFDEKPAYFRKYISAIIGRINGQVNLRKALHNVVALMSQPPKEGGYFRTMEQYVKSYLDSVELDGLLNQPEVEEMYMTSAIASKFFEADLAKYGYTWQQQLDMPVSEDSALSGRDLTVMDYMQKIVDGWEGSKGEWRASRALRMALGDMHAISLKYFEHGSRAFPPRDLREGGTSDYSSYSKADYLPFMAFYPQAHYGERYGLDATRMGGLLFLKVEGEDMGDVLKNWDHREVMMDLVKAQQQVHSGRTAEDEQNGTMRAIEWVSPGGAGGIYTRKDWRMIHAIEHFLDTRQPELQITESWKAIEGVGIEAMHEFANNIGRLNKNFYQPTGQQQRRELVHYLVRKYLHTHPDPGQRPDPDQMFADLERKGQDKSVGFENAYNSLFHRVLTGAIWQRIPTKFVRIENPREVVERNSAWEILRDQTQTAVEFAGLNDEQHGEEFQKAIRDIAVAEGKLRFDITRRLNDQVYEGVVRRGEKLYDLNPDQKAQIERITDDYKLDRERLALFLDDGICQGDQQRKARALAVYDRIQTFVHEYDDIVGLEGDRKTLRTKKYLDAFSQRYEEGRFPYSIAEEELERTFLSHASAGSNAPGRAIADIAATEETMNNIFLNYFEKMRAYSTSGNKDDFHELIEMLGHAHMQLEPDMGPDVSERFVHHLAVMTIKFFLKDTRARGLLQSIAQYGKVNSLSAEFVGPHRKVVEWEVNEANAFINAIEEAHILTRFGYDVAEREFVEKHLVDVKIPLTNRHIRLFKRFAIEQEGPWSSDRLRKETGVTNKQILWEISNKYVPLIFIFLMYTWIKSALEDDE